MVDKKRTSNENVDAATKERDKARLTLKHAKQRHALSVNQEMEKDRVKNEEVEQVNEGISDAINSFIDYMSAAKNRKHVEAVKQAISNDPKFADIVKNGFAKDGKWKAGYRKKFETYVRETMSPEAALKLGFTSDEKIANPNFMKNQGGFWGFMHKLALRKPSPDLKRYKKTGKKIGDPSRAGRELSDITKSYNKRAMEGKVSESVEQVTESQVLSNKKKELSSKMFGDVKYLNPAQRKELDKAAKAAVKADREAKKAKKAEPAAKTKTSKGKTHTGSGDPADRNLIMQLRKAQDALSPENFDILVSPTGKTINLPKKQIDDLLKKHDSLGKPVDKRKFKIMLTKALRAKAK